MARLRQAAVAGQDGAGAVVGSALRACPKVHVARPATSADSASLRARPSPFQNGIARRLARGVLDAHAAGLDAADLPRVRAEAEHVADHAVDGEVLVDGADHGLAGVLDDGVVGLVGDRPAGGERRQPAPRARRARPWIRSRCRQRAGAAAAGGDAVAEHGDDLVEVAAREPGVGQRRDGARAHSASTSHSSALQVATSCWARMSSGASRWTGRSMRLGLHRPHRGGALDQVVAGGGEDPRPWGCRRRSGRRWLMRWRRTRDRARRADLDHELDVADVDAELERGGGDYRP